MGFLDRLRNLFRRPAPAPPPVPAPVSSGLFLAAVNALRAERGLPPLLWDDTLAAVACGHAQVMSQVRQLAHEGIGDGTPAYRLGAAGVRWTAEGEVIAQAPDADGAMLLWKHSPPHYAILTDDFARMGGAGAGARGYWCVVVMR